MEIIEGTGQCGVNMWWGIPLIGVMRWLIDVEAEWFDSFVRTWVNYIDLSMFHSCTRVDYQWRDIRYILTSKKQRCHSLGIWQSTWDLGNFPSNLGNSSITRKFCEILVIRNLQRLTSVVCVHSLSHCLSLCHVSAITAFTYLDELISILNWFVQHWSKTE